MTTQMIVRLDSRLKAEVDKLAKAEGKTVSEVVRKLLQDYVQDRDIGAYIDDLWDRIGNKLAAKRVRPSDVAKIIREVRAKQ